MTVERRRSIVPVQTVEPCQPWHEFEIEIQAFPNLPGNDTPFTHFMPEHLVVSDPNFEVLAFEIDGVNYQTLVTGDPKKVSILASAVIDHTNKVVIRAVNTGHKQMAFQGGIVGTKAMRPQDAVPQGSHEPEDLLGVGEKPNELPENLGDIEIGGMKLDDILPDDE